MSQEQERLKSIAARSTYSAGVMTYAIEHCFKIIERHVKKSDFVLEIGPAEGVMTDLLAQKFPNLTVVEGADQFCKAIQSRHPNITVVNALIESFSTNQKFDWIILGHVLEHVEKPIEILKALKPLLASNGRLFCAVPNANSVHRQAAVEMGLLNKNDQLNQTDLAHGHRRVYCPKTLRHDFEESDLNIEVFGGYWLKPLANSQIESHWSTEMIRAFMTLGERYPDIAGEIYVIAKNSYSHRS